MRKRELKQKITEAYEAEMPDLRAEILDSCEKEQQEPVSLAMPAINKRQMFNSMLKRFAVAAVCLMLFATGISMGFYLSNGNYTPVPESAQAFVYLDINPSIELQLDGKNHVVECIAKNEDAQSVLSGLKLKNVDMNTALTAIVGALYVNGYLTENANSILVSVDAKDNSATDILLNDITNQINTVFYASEIDCSIIAQSVTVDDALKQKAESNGVSVGKMHLVDKMVDGIDTYDAEDTSALVDLSIKELNLIYATRENKDDEKDPFDKDVSSGNVGGFISQEDALTCVLASAEVSQMEVEWYQIQTNVRHHNSNKQIVYKVYLRIIDDKVTYEFEVDCQTGEIITAHSNKDEINSPPDKESPTENQHPDGNQNELEDKPNSNVHDPNMDHERHDVVPNAGEMKK